MTFKREYDKKYHTLSAQAIRITLFVYVYVRLLAPETCVLDIFLNPLFFFLDGMALTIEKDEKFLPFVYKKFRQFIVPYFFFAVLLVCFDIGLLPIEGLQPSHEQFWQAFFKIFTESRVYSLWYLPSLFFSEIFVYLMMKFSKEKLYLSTIYAFIMLALALIYNHFCHYYLPLALDTSFIGCFYLYFGYLLMHDKLEKVRNILFINRSISILIGVILMTLSTICALLIYKNYQSCFSGSKAIYSPYYFIIPSSFLGIFGIVFIAYGVRNPFFNHIGGMTMIILAFEEEVWIKIYKNVIAKNWYATFANNNHLWNVEEIFCCFLGALFAVFMSVPLFYLFLNTPLRVIFNKKKDTKVESVSYD